jgi:hypothetical protein
MKASDQLHAQWTRGKTSFDASVMRKSYVPVENPNPVAQPAA